MAMRAVAACLLAGIALVGGPAGGSGASAASGQCPPNARVHATPRALVPEEVVSWAGGRAVVGVGSVWIMKKVLTWRPVSDGDRGFSLKFPLYVVPAGELPTIEVARLVRGGRRTESVAAEPHIAYAGGTTFVTSTLPFSRSGCWEVIARHRDSAVRLQVRVR